jgi:P27 family predicted phage terminase small subunit
MNKPSFHRFQRKQDLPKPPKHLQKATKTWFEHVVSTWELEEHHVRLLTLAGEAWDRAEQARTTIAKVGLTYMNKAGEPRRHPAVQIEHDARIGFARLLRELALDVSTPADDSRPPGIRR